MTVSPLHSLAERAAHTSECFIVAVIIALSFVADANAQNSGSVERAGAANEAVAGAPKASEKAARGSIKGRVVGEDGRPLPFARVSADLKGSAGKREARYVHTDEKGRFTLDDLPYGPYELSVHLASFIREPLQPHESAASRIYRVGESVTIRLVKGGVITGKVTGGRGEPIAGVYVRAQRVRRPGGDIETAVMERETRTDDRGVYRIYGLNPGGYIVVAGGSNWTWSPSSGYENAPPTFYPSSTAEGAVEVAVQAGQETSGIDINYRTDEGRAVSGTFTIPPIKMGDDDGVTVELTHAATGMRLGLAYISKRDANSAFSFGGVPDGDYLLIARYSPDYASLPQRVTVRGADVTNLRLALAPLASVSGKVVLEPLKGDDAARRVCVETRSKMLPGEVLITARRHEGELQREPRHAQARSFESSPDDAGEFTIRQMRAGSYRLGVSLLGEGWYVKSLRRDGVAGNDSRQSITASPTSTTKTPKTQTADAPPDLFRLSDGQRLSGFVVNVAEGAGRLSGRVTRGVDGAASSPLPLMRVYLLPAERERAADPLHHHETLTGGDGSFAFRNIAPGRYTLFASAEAQGGESLRTTLNDSDERTRLRREAEAAGTAVEIPACGRIDDFMLDTGAAARKPRP